MLGIGLWLGLSFAAIASPLQNHPSAYLAMHANDPVAWQLWQTPTLQLAQQQNKLILISSGYFACHWCHVMQQENYQDTEVAALLNRHFISIKVDRELNPDLDDYLLNFARQTTGQAGWPLHVILTPEGLPIAAFIYQPRDALIRTLSQLQAWWQQDPARLRQLAKPTIDTPFEPISLPQLRDEFMADLIPQLDQFAGGLNGTQKFPHSPLLKTLLMQTDLPTDVSDWLKITLEQMQSEHLYDHVHDGFFRYTVDPNWQEPHFEKMLYDNAQLAEVYFRAARYFDRADFLTTAKQTLAYIERELYSPTTGLARASQSALDENGVDGGRYIWSASQLQLQLTKQQFAQLNQAWLLNQAPPFATGWLPKPLNQSKSDHQAWLTIQQQLKTRPAITDDKQLLSWNGLLLSAYAEAYISTQQPDYLRRGHALAQRLLDLMQQTQPPRAINDRGQLLGQAALEDYAYIIGGLRQWQLASGITFKTEIQALQHQTRQRFRSNNGWLASLDNLLPGQVAQADFADLATPSVSAILNCDQRIKSIPIIQRQTALNLWQYASYLQRCEF